MRSSSGTDSSSASSRTRSLKRIHDVSRLKKRSKSSSRVRRRDSRGAPSTWVIAEMDSWVVARSEVAMPVERYCATGVPRGLLQTVHTLGRRVLEPGAQTLALKVVPQLQPLGEE